MKYSKFSFIVFLLTLYDLHAEKSTEGSIIIDMKSANITVPYSKGKTYFTIQLLIGNPPQKFDVQLDTSTATSWVPSKSCKNCGSAKSYYDFNLSSTSSPSSTEAEIDDEDGDVEGTIAHDNIEVSGFKLKQYGFVEVKELDDDFNDHYDGKLGLGFRGEKGHEFNFIEKLQHDGLISKRVFSLNHLNDTFGIFLVGDLPVQNYKFCNVTFTEDLDDEYREGWVCELTHVGYNVKNSSNSLNTYEETEKGRVDFDSAYDYIAVPRRDWGIIQKVLLNEFSCSFSPSLQGEDSVKYICDKKAIEPNAILTFVLQGNGYAIKVTDLFKDINENKMEFLCRYIDDDDAIWTFGYPFMKNYITIFNMEERHVGIYTYSTPSSKGRITNLEKDWNVWYLNEKKEIEEAKNLALLIVILSISSLILFLVCVYCIIRYLRKKKLEGDENIPMRNRESNYNDDRIY